MNFLILENLEIPGDPQASQRLTEKRQQFFTTQESQIGLNEHPSSSLPLFFSLLFPAYLKRSASRPPAHSFIQSACTFLLDALKRTSGFSSPLFPATPDAPKPPPPMPLEATLRASNATVRATLGQTGTLALCGIAAELTSRMDVASLVQGTQRNAISTLSIQHPFFQCLTPVPHSFTKSKETGAGGYHNRKRDHAFKLSNCYNKLIYTVGSILMLL